MSKFETKVTMHKQNLNITDVYMKVHAKGITFPVDIKPGKGDKSISPGQVRYAIRIIYMYEEKSIILDIPLKRYLRNKK